MSSVLSVAAVQLKSTGDVEDNLSRTKQWVERAADAGARLVALPENFGFLGPEAEKLKYAAPLEDSFFLEPLRPVAAQRKLVIVAGGVPETSADPNRAYNTAVLILPDGSLGAAYRKIHLFDVDLADGTKLMESEAVIPGDEPVVAEVDGWKVGLSICYDVRFPELYRQLVASGAEIIMVPAAFTLHTGKDHWDVLLRARAIENQCFVVAPAQFGHHGRRRASWGKAQVVDPWGTVLSLVPEREGLALAQLERDDLERVRKQLPSLTHRRL